MALYGCNTLVICLGYPVERTSHYFKNITPVKVRPFGSTVLYARPKALYTPYKFFENPSISLLSDLYNTVIRIVRRTYDTPCALVVLRKVGTRLGRVVQ